MFFAKADQIGFADQRLAAGVDVHVDAKLFTLPDNIVDLIIGQIQLVAVFGRPAAGTVQITGRGRVEKDRPRNVAVVFLPVFLLPGPPDKTGVDKKIDSQRFHDVGVNLRDKSSNIGIIRMLRICNCLPDRLSLRSKLAPGKLIRPIHQLAQIFFRILVEITKCLLQSELFNCGRHVHNRYLP